MTAGVIPAKKTITFILIQLCFFSIVFGQTPVYYLNGNVLDVEIYFNSGTEINNFQMEISPSYDIDHINNAYGVSTGSWLCNNGNCSESLSFNPTTNTIYLELQANTAKSGEGLIYSLKGIIIEPDDIDFRANNDKLDNTKPLQEADKKVTN